MKKMMLAMVLLMAPMMALAELICAVVKIEIRQEVTFERQAFEAKMVITNGLEALDLSELGINVVFRDVDGNPVTASYNHAQGTDDVKFFITVDYLDGLEDSNGQPLAIDDLEDVPKLTDGMAVLPAGETAEIRWLIIPRKVAVPAGNKIGETYGVGATVNYKFGEESQTIEVAPDYIEVRPTPFLKLDYFLPADVFADDPNTPPPIIEPAEPFDLGLRVKNIGDGEATNLKIESAQPTITENNQGLLIDFTLLGTSVNDQPVVPSLLADIGTLPSEESAMVSWQMTTSLTGQFVDFSADYVHSDDLGGELTSLIDGQPQTHTLLHKVKVAEADRDGVTDFLAFSGDTLYVYESNGMDVRVDNLEILGEGAVVDNGVSNDRRFVTVTVTPEIDGDPVFVHWPDDYAGIPQMITAIRDDNKVLPTENIWQYKVEGDPGVFTYFIGLFDTYESYSHNGNTVTYTVIFDGLEPNARPEVAVTSPQTGYVNQAMSFDILVTDDDSQDVLTLTPLSLPVGASLTATGSGTWQFNWTPDAEGTFNASFRASDGTVDEDVNVQLIISQLDPDDTDGDGLLDAWEMEHFGDLDEDGTGDFDQDSATDKQEHDHGGNPTVEDRPQAVVIESPLAGAQVAVEPTEFMIVNSVGAVDAAMVYEFEMYENSLQNLFFSETIDESELSTTVWAHGQILTEDVRYIWRVRAFDGVTYSNWSYDEFFFSATNNAPEYCGLEYPEAGLSVNDNVVELSVNQGLDAEGDALQYRFEVFEDAAKTIMLADSGWLQASSGQLRSWQPYNEYEVFVDYFWTAKVTDGNNEVLCADSQFTSGVNVSPQTGYQLNAPVNQALTGVDVDLIVDAPLDVFIDIEIDVQPDFTSPGIQQFTQVTDVSGQVIWSVTGLTDDTVYYWRARGNKIPEFRYGRWQYGQFTTQKLGGAPLIKTVNPADQSWVSTVTPELKVAIDQYTGFAETFQVDIYEDADATVLFSSQVVDQPVALSPAMTDRNQYYWQAKALNGDGSETPFSPLQSVFVIDDLVDDVPAFEFVSLQQATSTAASNFRIEWLASDADSDANIDLYYDLDNSGSDGVLIVAGLSENSDDSYDWDISALAGNAVYLYAVISDGSSSVVSYSTETLQINASVIEVLAVDNAVSEAGDQATVNVTLVQQPEDYVIIPVTVSDDSEISTDVSQLLFDLNNWSLPQAITVTGVDDTLVDGDQVAALQFGPIQSADAQFAATQIADLEVTNVDDDIPGVLFTALAGSTTSETGDVISFEVTLLTEPSDNVILDLSSSIETEGQVSPAQLTFTSTDWNTPQVINVIGQDDAVVDGDVTYDINTAVSSVDVNYDGLVVDALSLTNTDDDQAGVSVTAIGGTTTTEAGGTAQFEVTLTSEPLHAVNVSLLSSDEEEGTVDVSLMVFDAINWNQAQVVTITGQDDPLVDGDQAYLLSFTSSSTDVNYEGIVIADVNLTNEDNDSTGLIITPQGALQTSEAGGSVDVTISLTAEPTADVTVTFNSSDASEALVAPTGLVFTTVNWSTEQTITLTGQDDALIDGDQNYQVSITISSADASYDGLAIPAIDATNTDDDVAGVTVLPVNGLTTSEQGGTAKFGVVLNSEPEADVTIAFNSSDVSEGTVDSGVTFTAANWNVAQDVLITGVDDGVVDGDVDYTINGAVSSTDGHYDGLAMAVVSVTNIDDDVAAVIMNNLSGFETDEAGQLQAQFDVSLSVEPTADVILDFNVSDATEAQIAVSQLTFTPSDWSQSQSLTVVGLDDEITDYDVNYDLTYVINSTDVAYAAVVPEVTNLVNLDDDVPQQIEVYYLSENVAKAQVLCNMAAAQVSEPDQVCVHSDAGAEHPHWSYDGFLRWPEVNGIDHQATYYYGISCPVGSYLNTDKGCVNEDDQGPQTMSPMGEGGGTVIAKAINVATGNHHHHEPLLKLGHGLKFGVTYNSHTEVDAFGEPVHGDTGMRWTHDYNRSVSGIYLDESGVEWVNVTRPDGRIYQYYRLQFNWVATNHVKSGLEQTSKGWTFYAKNGDKEYYDSQGRLNEIRLNTGERIRVTHNSDHIRVTDEYGLYINIFFDVIDSVIRINSVTDSSSRGWTFTYTQDNITHINYPSSLRLNRKIFHYENSKHPGLLTGITDQRGIRYSTFVHDGQGRLISSELANGVNRISISYTSDINRTLTNSLDAVSSLEVEKSGDLWRLKSFSGPGCSGCELGNESFDYDAQNNLISHTNEGTTTTYGGYDTKGQFAYRIEADEPGVGAHERRTDYTYDSRFYGKVASISEPSVFNGQNKVTSYVYDNYGQVTSVSSSGFRPDGTAISRSVAHTYAGPFNQISLDDGPRPGAIDQTDYVYYAKDNPVVTRQNRLKRVTGPGGLVERDQIRWSASGKVTEEQRPNGVTIEYTYEPSTDRLLSSSEYMAVGTETRVTQYGYLHTGHLSSVTENYGTAKATRLSLTYDDALRLIQITDEADNRIEYTLDSEGNLLSEQSFGKGVSIPSRVINQSFDAYGYLASRQQSGVSVTYDYSSNGDLNSYTNGKGVTTDYSYDSLNRLTQKTQDYLGTVPATANTMTQFSHDVADRVKTTTDARGNVTTHHYDDFGNLITLISPDSGTSHQTYDAAGNKVSKTDANGHLVERVYDGRNRLTLVEYADSSLDNYFFYDQGAGGLGQLTGFIDQSGQTAFTYDAFGNLLSKAQEVSGFDATSYAAFNDLTISYSYDSYDRLASMSYPSGMTLAYEYDDLNQVKRITTTSPTGITDSLITGVSYLPFGPIESINFGNGQHYNALYDNGYRMTGYNYGVDVTASFNHDNNHNITYVTREISTNNDWFSYDRLDRLTSENYLNTTYSYDKAGNRIMREAGGNPSAKANGGSNGGLNGNKSETIITNYTIDPNSNRLMSINFGANRVYDANGNTLQTHHTGDKQWIYNQANRMSTHTQGVITRAVYRYNALGERVHKTHNKTNGALAGEFLFLYDEQGRLVHVSKYKNGQHIWDRENVYLGDRLIAQIRKFYSSKGMTHDDIYYIQTDHLHAPRWITNDAGVRIWSLESDAFGTTSPEKDVDGDGSNFHFYLRSSGQYDDGESGMHHNYWRDYDPEIGRYLQSNPVGTDAGLNPYEFSMSSPIMQIQRLGQGLDQSTSCTEVIDALGGLCQYIQFPEMLTPDQSWGPVLNDNQTNR